MMSQLIGQEVFEFNITTLLSHPKYKTISKLVSSNNEWVRLNYKDKQHFLTPNDSWDDIVNVCDAMLK